MKIFFLSFFPFVTEKDEKTCFDTETNDFDQQTACGVRICWLKYATPSLFIFNIYLDTGLSQSCITFSIPDSIDNDLQL